VYLIRIRKSGCMVMNCYYIDSPWFVNDKGALLVQEKSKKFGSVGVITGVRSESKFAYEKQAVSILCLTVTNGKGEQVYAVAVSRLTTTAKVKEHRVHKMYLKLQGKGLTGTIVKGMHITRCTLLAVTTMNTHTHSTTHSRDGVYHRTQCGGHLTSEDTV
jgi:hypothetical protein